MKQNDIDREEAELIAMEEAEADREWAELLTLHEKNDREEAGENASEDSSGSSL